ncbi:MAG: homocysteine S-methyltransferase family protein [Armatimonadota bacterium]|nr:MAG: homocysteine S-methyltransferase family protein [Armatimonadota bacterium]
MGTTLSASGHEFGGALELLNVEQPDRVRAVHRGFLEAGAQVLQTNTFQGSRPVLDNHGLGDRTVELNTAAAALARELAGDRAFVAGDIGPTGKLLEPYGDFEQAAARAAFEEQARALAEAGVDFLIVETMSAIEEAVLAVAAAAATGLPVVASMAFLPVGRTDFGVSTQQAADQLAEAGAIVVGANCGVLASAEMVEIIRLFREATSLPLIAQPNAGRPQRTDSGVIFPETPEAMAEAAPRFREYGATLIGGCCGSTPDHIRAIAARLEGE